MVDGGDTTMAGLLLLVGLLAAVAASILLFARPAFSRIATLCIGVCGLMLLLLPILAWTTWPPEQYDFWDSQHESGQGVTSDVSTYASFGWYTAIVGMLFSVFAA